MYAHAPSIPSRRSFVRFDNYCLQNAVRIISDSLVKRAGLSSRDAAYASLLSDIWGRSQYASAEVMEQKRSALTRKRARRSSDQKTVSEKLGREVSDYLADHRREKSQLIESHDDIEKKLKLQKKNAARDKLVRILRAVREHAIDPNERRLSRDIIIRDQPLDVDALRRLWGIPKVIFEATGLDQYFAQHHCPDLICAFYDAHISRASPDAKIFNILYWKESKKCTDDCIHHCEKQPGGLRTISKSIVSHVIKLLLTKRRSPFFEKNMDVVIETVLYAIHPDRFVDRFRESSLRESGFFLGLQSYEYSRSFAGSMENLQLGKLNRMLKDIRAVRAYDKGNNSADPPSEYLSLRAVCKYCKEKDTLTDRAVRGVHDRYVRRRGRSESQTDEVKMRVSDFVRMYLALVRSGTDPGLKYWFSVLDQDGDGWVGVGDIAHFYSERKLESEKRNGIKLADAQCLWIRLCAMIGVSPKSRGLNLNALKELGKADREFVMCALLVRRADDGNLINVAATMSADPESIKQL